MAGRSDGSVHDDWPPALVGAAACTCRSAPVAVRHPTAAAELSISAYSTRHACVDVLLWSVLRGVSIVTNAQRSLLPTRQRRRNPNTSSSEPAMWPQDAACTQAPVPASSTPYTECKRKSAQQGRLRSPGRRCRVRRAGGGGGRHLAPPGPQRPTLPPAPAPAPLSHHRGESEFAPRPAARGRPGGRPAGYRHTPAQHGLPPCPQQALAA